MHRAIDKFTDEDQDVRKLNRLIAKRHGRYAGVVSDIGFDYFLWRNWEVYGPGDFSDFTRTTYQGLFAHREHMSDRVKGYVDGMVKDDWLRLYTSLTGMHQVYHRLRPRLSRPEQLDGIEHLLVDFEEEFNQTFLLLFPRLQALANAYRPNSANSN